jgi:hypothetical protein
LLLPNDDTARQATTATNLLQPVPGTFEAGRLFLQVSITLFMRRSRSAVKKPEAM